MKITIKLLLLLCVAALAITTSCTSEGEGGNPSNGEGGNTSTNYPFTLGKYHPEKKIKRIVVFDYSVSSDTTLGAQITYDFTWNGDNLYEIAFSSQAQQWSRFRDVCFNGRTRFSYNNNGRIDAFFTDYQKSNNSDEYGTDESHVTYTKDDYYDQYVVVVSTSRHRHLWDYYEDGYGYGFQDDSTAYEYEFRGGEYGYNNMANGNYVRDIYNNYVYDTKINPFKDLICGNPIDIPFYCLFYYSRGVHSDNGHNTHYSCLDIPFICTNNIVRTEAAQAYGQYFCFTNDISYSGNYPILISRKEGVHLLQMKIEYY